MFRLLVIAVAGFVLYKLITNNRGDKKLDPDKETPSEIEENEMVKDPVCGTYVRLDNDIRVRKGQQVYYFCSYECRDEFLKKLKSGEK